MSDYAVVDGSGTNLTAVPYTSTGLHLIFQLTAANTYALTVIDNATGASYSIPGTLAHTNALTSIALFNNNAGQGVAYDLFFNSLRITGP